MFPSVVCKPSRLISIPSFALLLCLSSCGGESDAEKPVANAGADQSFNNASFVQLDGSLSRNAAGGSGSLTYRWEQVGGSAVDFIEEAGESLPNPSFITPSELDETLVFELTVTDGDKIDTDTVEIAITQCSADEGVIFEDCIAQGYGPISVWEDLAEGEDGTRYNGRGDQHIQWEIVDGVDFGHGKVLQVQYNANDPFDDVNDNGNFHIGFPSSAANIGGDISDYRGGSLSFDARILASARLSDMMSIALECFWPCVSGEAWMEDPEFLGDWKTYTYSIDYLVQSGLDLSDVSSVFRFSLPWGLQQGRLHLQFDNIKLSKTYEPMIAEPAPPSESQVHEIITDSTTELTHFSPLIESGPIADLTALGGGVFQVDVHTNVSWAELISIGVDNSLKNLSHFYHGNIVFDIQVLAYNGNTEGDFLVNYRCTAKCTATPGINIGRPAEGVWQAIEVPVKELFARGATNLKNVDSEFVLDYTGEITNGISLYVRNLRWEYIKQ